jgi:hypothetical protein
VGRVEAPLTWRDFPRPTGDYYETRFSYLCQGDIFHGIPYTLIGPELLLAADKDLPGPHALMPLASVQAMLITPTCDFRRASAERLQRDSSLAPYTLEQRVRVAQLLSLDEVEGTFDARNRRENLDKIRRFDSLRRFMYLPALGDTFPESAVALGPTWLVHLRLLLNSTRLTQLTFTAAQQVHYKIVMYETSTIVNRTDFLPPID